MAAFLVHGGSSGAVVTTSAPTTSSPVKAIAAEGATSHILGAASEHNAGAPEIEANGKGSPPPFRELNIEASSVTSAYKLEHVLQKQPPVALSALPCPEPHEDVDDFAERTTTTVVEQQSMVELQWPIAKEMATAAEETANWDGWGHGTGSSVPLPQEARAPPPPKPTRPIHHP